MSKVLLFLSLILTSGCATIIHGSRQKVGVSSNPSGATVYIDGQMMGRTPTIVVLTRKDFHHVKIVLPGYMPYETDLIRKVDAWIAGNILFGGLIGLGVDAVSGSMYKLTPDQIIGELHSGAPSVTSRFKQKGIFITVVSNPKKDWQLIGHLKEAN